MRSASPRALLATASVAVALAAADTYVVVLALPDMMAGVGLGIESLQRATPIVSGFLLGYVAVLPLIGRLADLLPRQRVLLGCLVVFVVGSVLTATAVELPVLVSGRVLQGVGGGGLVPATLALVADLWPPERRGTPLGGRRRGAGARQRARAAAGGGGPGRGGLARDLLAQRLLGLLLAVAVLATGAGPGRGAAPGRRRARAAPVLAVLTSALGLLTLLAPERLVTGVTTGIPFIPLVGTSRVATPIGVATLVLLVALAAVTARRWGPALAAADAPGRPARGGRPRVPRAHLRLRRPGAGGRRAAGPGALPVGVLAVGGYVRHARRAPQPLVARGVVRGGWPLRWR